MAQATKQWKAAQATEEVVQRMFDVCGWEDVAADELLFTLPRGKEVAA